MFSKGKVKDNEACPGLSMEDHAESLAMFTLRDQDYSKEDLEYTTNYFFNLLTKEFDDQDDMLNFVDDLDITLDPGLIKGLIAWRHGDVVDI